ncbi:Signal transduction histidine kinase [Duganella sp. CF402]|uniref:HAMP domain-containing sensor histidine kinase n=1 Tax=unclassified Duganella TaxID=2636909 RepID=UPI0008D3DEB0|nr:MULTISPECIES: HAMP domain-containing sensor histidine kinase [unclassified Duganella]RZT09655.1 signal transduction histidine kinase [Duganella sp. BK701]SEL48394.1 Signal transduction histidine kinase [Duganella sp. CF402]
MNLTLSQRLSLAFCLLLLVCCGASAWLQIRANIMHEKEVVQGLSRGLARSIALDAQLMQADEESNAQAPASDGLGPAAVRRLFNKLMSVNPSVEVYLLDNDGRVVGHAAPAGHLKRDHVNLEPIRRLLNDEPLPIQGDDPRSERGRKVFSAAVLRSGEQKIGYIYVILQSEEHDRLAARATASSVLRTTLWSMAVVAALVLAAGLIAFRLITRPLHRLTATMQQLDTQADQLVLPAPQRGGPRDEIAILEQSFADMGARINEQWKTMRQLDHDRREVVANISHDLRTPLGSIHGYLETLSLKDETLDPAERQRYLGIALSQSRKVGQLAQALFELARLEHGSVTPELEPFSLSDLIQDVFQKFELQAQERNIRLMATLPHPAPMVRADLGMIERVLTNLFDNAIRHTPSGGEVEITVQAAVAGAVAVTVADTGPGVPAALRENLFRRPVALQGEYRVGGLGLLTVNRILQLHRSKIELASEPGQGAVFRFTLEAA